MNILALAAYERARRALRGECEPNSRPKVVRTNISNKVSENKAKCARWVLVLVSFDKIKKDRQKRSLWSGGSYQIRTTVFLWFFLLLCNRKLLDLIASFAVIFVISEVG